MVIQQIRNPHSVHFGAVSLKQQNGASDKLKLNNVASEKSGWESQNVVSAKDNQSLAHVEQAKNAKTNVQFFNGKGGFSAIVTTGDLRFIALPGSHIELSDTLLDMPGASITGSSVANDKASTLQQTQTVTDQAMIICAGESTRFEPLTEATEFTKHSTPLVGNDSVVVSVARQLYQHGIRNIIINTCFKPYKIEEQMAQFNQELKAAGKEPVKFTLFREAYPSGDAGGLLVGLQKHPDLFDHNKHLLSIYGDAVTSDVDFSAFLNAAKENGAKITLGAKRVTDDDLKTYGFAVTDKSGKDGESGFIKEFVEKPGRADEAEGAGRTSAEKMARLGDSRLANTGILVFSPEVLKSDYQQKALPFQREKKLFSWSYHFFPHVMEKYGSKAMWAERIRGYWSDIGNPEQYIATVKDILDGKMGADAAKKMTKRVDENGVIYYDEALRSKVHYEGSPFQLEGNIVVANAPKG